MMSRLRNLTRSAEGHLWTILPALQDTAQPAPRPPEEPWELTMDDHGTQTYLSGSYTRHEHARGLVIIVPGLGATPKSSYCLRCATTLLRAGYSSLRLGTTLCPTEPPDFSRRQLARELTAALSCKPLSRYRNVYLLGYSIGGHGVLRAAADGLPDQVRALTVISTPFDLALSQSHMDAPGQLVYRRYIIALLNDLYTTEARRGMLPNPPPGLADVQTLRDYDATLNTMGPKGYPTVDAYYREASARWVLDQIEQPVLAVISPTDPMVPADTVRSAIAGYTDQIDVRWPSGGHIYFPDDTDLGEAGPKGLIRQVVTWWNRVSPVN